jgi:uncharacterized membrane protein YgdD (TMEM256/DUF423 family)
VDRLLYLCAAVAGALGFLLGAFAAHGLKARIGADLHATFETAVRYQMYHAFALFAAAWALAQWKHRAFAIGGWLFVAGIVIFCGSLYCVALTGMRGIGGVTPIGGLAFLAGWLCLAWGAAARLRS